MTKQPATGPPAGVSVLIVSWQSRAWLERCLASLDPARHDIVVCDNASDDGSASFVAERFPAVTLLRQTRNLGFAGGVNAARRAATGAYLLLLNPDAAATPGAVERLAATLDATPGVGAVAGRLVDEDGRDQTGFNVRRLPTLTALAVDLLLVDHVWPSNPATARYYARDVNPDASAEVEQPAAACLMVRAELFDRLGGLDERFSPAWWEDVDFCRRLLATGARIRYEPAAVFRHGGGASVARLGRHEFARLYYRNLRRYVRKHHGAPAAALFAVLTGVGRILRRVVPG